MKRLRFSGSAVGTGESGDYVYRRDDRCAYAKIARSVRSGDLAGERDRLVWLRSHGVACPEVVDWSEMEEGACLVMTAVPGVPANEMQGADLLKAWSSIVLQLERLHALPRLSCPFDRRLASMMVRARDVVARGGVNPDFLPDEDKATPPHLLLARIEHDLPIRLEQEIADTVICHGDACLPNFMVDPIRFQCAGMIDVGRLGTADRYADLALLLANARENWISRKEEARAAALLFDWLGIDKPDQGRLAFYLRLDPLTWE